MSSGKFFKDMAWARAQQNGPEYAVRKMFWSPGDKVAVVQDGETKMYAEVVNEHWQGKYLVKELGRPANAMIVRWDELESVPLPF